MRREEVRIGSPRVYLLGPFALRSELELPELSIVTRRAPRVDGDSLLPVDVRIGPFEADLGKLIRIDECISASSTEFLLTIPQVGHFWARHGTDVLIAPVPGVAEVDLRLYLLGSVFGALCHQNGLLPLHASAIADRGRVIAFLGDSGAGKSTLAAFLARRGHAVVADDICLLGRSQSSDLTVTPVAGWLKLWRHSLDGLRKRPIEKDRVLSGEDKYRVYLQEPANRSVLPVRLACVVLLERPASEQESSPRILALSAAATVAALMNMTYLPELADGEGERETLFRRCAQISGQVRAVRLIAPLGWNRMDEVLDLIERELLDFEGS